MTENRSFTISEAEKGLTDAGISAGLDKDEVDAAKASLRRYWPILELANKRWLWGLGPKSEIIAAIRADRLKSTKETGKRSEAEVQLLICSAIRQIAKEKWDKLASSLVGVFGKEAIDGSRRIVFEIDDPIDLKLALAEIADRRSLLHAQLSDFEKKALLSGHLSIVSALERHGIDDIDGRVDFLRAQMACSSDPEWFVANYTREYAEELYQRYGFHGGERNSFSSTLIRTLSGRNDIGETVQLLGVFGYAAQEIWDDFFEQIPPSSVVWFQEHGIDINAPVDGEMVKTAPNSTYVSADQRRRGHPLNIAVRGGSYDLAKSLLRCGASVDEAFADGPSCVLYALSAPGITARAAHDRTLKHLAAYSDNQIKDAGWHLSPYQLAKDAQCRPMSKHLTSLVDRAKPEDFFEPAVLPERTEGIDWLIKHLELTSRPIAQWEGRYDSLFLTRLAEACARYPGVFDGSADRHLRYSNYWSKETRYPLSTTDNLDRKGSFVGAFPWTSRDFPWPENEEGEALSPVLQLNLKQMPLDKIGINAEALLQVWGDDYTPIVRFIPLDAIEGAEPDTEMKAWSNDLLGYDSGTGCQIGEVVEIEGDWRFSISREIEIDPDWPEDWDGDPAMADVLRELRGAWEELEKLASQEMQISDHAADGFFGGQMDGRQSSFYEFEDCITVYSPASLFMADGPGLVTLRDGTLSVMLSADQSQSFFAYVDR